MVAATSNTLCYALAGTAGSLETSCSSPGRRSTALDFPALSAPFQRPPAALLAICLRYCLDFEVTEDVSLP